ncbi:MAG: N-acetylmuramoyl-L-alanine amidase [Ruminiclostridium sp.]|nr:N-acetylmuramoyl-L-alanine amidase [Ruminiclostridium sp.]
MRIFLDPGHGGSDPGAAKIIKESQYTLIYALELGRALKGLGFEVNYSRTSDSDVSLAERCRMANTWKADYFISIHFNSGGGTGIETFALAAGGNAERLAKAVQSPLIAHTGMRDRGVKFANFQVLRDTKMPAILIEGGFVDHEPDAQKIQTEEYKRKYVQGVTKGVCGATGTTWKDPYVAVVDNAKKSIAPDDIYLSVRVREHKADALVKQIQGMGFACEKLDLA